MTDEELRHLFETLRRESAVAHQETRRHSELRAEHAEKRFDLLAEGLQVLRDESRETAKRLEATIDRSASETQSMIKFSHRELDHRVSILEEGQHELEESVADLRARLARLESRTESQ